MHRFCSSFAHTANRFNRTFLKIFFQAVIVPRFSANPDVEHWESEMSSRISVIDSTGGAACNHCGRNNVTDSCRIIPDDKCETRFFRALTTGRVVGWFFVPIIRHLVLRIKDNYILSTLGFNYPTAATVSCAP